VEYRADEMIVKLLYREIFKSIEKTLEDHTDNVRGSIKVIQGPAGAGKSMTLLYACHYARKLGWIVVYVPNLAEFVSKTAIFSKFVVGWMDIQSQTVKPQLERIKEQDTGAQRAYEALRQYELLVREITTRREVWIELLTEYMAGLLCVKVMPVLVAVDEWNCLIPHSTDDEKTRRRLEEHPASQIFSSDLLLAAPVRGVYMCAVSSALTNARLPEYDLSLAFNISYMNSDVSKRFAQQYAQFMGLNFDDEGLEKIVALCSGIPALVYRLLGVVKRAKAACDKTDSSEVDKIDEKAEQQFKVEGRSFFERYINKLIMRISEKDHEDLIFIMYSILNIETPVNPVMFRAIGVIDSKDKLVSPLVKQVLAKKIVRERPRIFQYLLPIGSPQVNVLETMFFAEWSTGYFHEIDFKTQNAKGNRRENVSFKFDEVIFQSRIPTSLGCQPTLCKRKMLKLFKGHAGLDFVGLTEQGLLILGQLSITNYDGGSHDVNKLLTDRRKLSAEKLKSQQCWGIAAI
jgi:hypothetical protein